MITENCYIYISALADCDPVRTVFLCAPSENSRCAADAKAFAEESGWIKEAEHNKAVLIVPFCSETWDRTSVDLLSELAKTYRNKIFARRGRSIWGRGGRLWLWEVLTYGVGYKDGAEYLGKVMTAHPAMFAATALIDGVPGDFSAGDRPSEHIFVPEVSDDYDRKNNQIPVHTWLLSERKSPELIKAAEYFESVNKAAENEAVDYGVTTTDKVSTESYSPAEIVDKASDSEASAPQVKVIISKTNTDGKYDEKLSEKIMKECFSHVLRWKNGPDGTLSLVPSEGEFYASGRYIRRTVGIEGCHYDFFVHIPEGMTKEEVKGLPLVISIHGRGEPAWLYTDKNGWESLADKTKAFVTISPDSPGNIWFRTRDAKAFPAMIDLMALEFCIDRSRVFLTGFSNGGTMTRETALLYPGLFAGISPWNGPAVDTKAMLEEDSSSFEMVLSDDVRKMAEKMAQQTKAVPVFAIYGDKDPGIGVSTNYLLPYYLQNNNCKISPCKDQPTGYEPDEIRTAQNYYTKERGYLEGERFTTYVYKNQKTGKPGVCVTVIKNMPHGAIKEEALAAYSFFIDACP